MPIDPEIIASLFTDTPGGVTLRVKVIAGASRTRPAGIIGDRLKLAVAAAPEAGKANKAVGRLIARLFGIPPCDVAITAGHTQPLKSVRLAGLTPPKAIQRLSRQLNDDNAQL